MLAVVGTTSFPSNRFNGNPSPNRWVHRGFSCNRFLHSGFGQGLRLWSAVWSQASPHASNLAVSSIGRIRALPRYEVANNSYARGIVLTLAKGLSY